MFSSAIWYVRSGNPPSIVQTGSKVRLDPGPVSGRLAWPGDKPVLLYRLAATLSEEISPEGANRMKRGTLEHPKLVELRDRLRVRRPTAVGYLEMLWHFTARFAPQGDIGRYSDRRIEAALDWSGGPGKLVDTLVNAGWLDRHPKWRLLVHDWHDHADDSVRKRLARYKLPFLSVLEEVTGQDAVSDREVSATVQTAEDFGSLPEPSQIHARAMPEPEAPPTEAHAVRSQEHSVTPNRISPATWDDFRNRYAESGKPLNEANWTKAGMEAATLNLSESDMTKRVIPSLAAELPEWADRNIGMVPFPANWLKSQPWTRTAQPRKRPQSASERLREAVCGKPEPDGQTGEIE